MRECHAPTKTKRVNLARFNESPYKIQGIKMVYLSDNDPVTFCGTRLPSSYLIPTMAGTIFAYKMLESNFELRTIHHITQYEGELAIDGED